MLTAPSLFLLPFIGLYVIHQIATRALPHFFLVPPHLWQKKILSVIEYPKPIYLKVGRKRSSYRRRLITASVQPSFYTNFVNNKLKIHPTDRENENDSFMSAMKNRAALDANRKVIYGFFHPYANNGGGGEKVLWHAVQATLLEDPRNIVAIYTTNVEAEPLQILGKAESKFKVGSLDSKRIVFIYLRRYAQYIDGNYWKHFTLIGQLWGSLLLGLEAMYELSPDVWVDTQGLPGSYMPVSMILKTPIIAYVHYPMIQPDMFNRLKFQTFSDLRSFRLSDLRQLVKFFYWKALYAFYMYLGSCVDVTLANGTWTYNHLCRIWAANKGLGKVVDVLYPPCSTETLSYAESAQRSTLLYIAQFRPEKRHALVLEEFSKFVASAREAKIPLANLPQLVFLGSCRTPTDGSTLEKAKEMVQELELVEYVNFVVDCSFEEVQENLARAKFGLNAMWNEHFGIGVVEYLSAGAVPIVHASAGPLLDIVAEDKPTTTWENELGFFFKSEDDPDLCGVENGELKFEQNDEPVSYPALSEVLCRLYIKTPELASDAALEQKRSLGQKVVQAKFSNKAFKEKWIQHLKTAAQLEAYYRENRRDKVNAVY